MSDYALIPLTRGQFAKVSPEDFEWLSQWKWYATWNSGTRSFYAVRKERSASVDYTVGMHRAILRLDRGDKRHGDHINHDTLDNRRSNLRVATSTENHRNSRRYRNNRSGIPGIGWCQKTQSWQAYIKVDGKLIHLGYRKDISEAVSLRQAAEARHFGAFAASS